MLIQPFLTLENHVLYAPVGAASFRTIDLVHATSYRLGGKEDITTPLAAALTSMFVAIDTIDSLMDGDPINFWEDKTDAELILAATTLLSPITDLMIADLNLPIKGSVQLGELWAKNLLEMAAGQHNDFLNFGSHETTAASIIEDVEAKSGAFTSLMTQSVALLTRQNEEVTDALCTLGRLIGTASQIKSDCADLLKNGRSKDLDSGAVTLPIAIHLESLTLSEKSEFSKLLQDAKSDLDARAEVRNRLQVGEIQKKCAAITELYRIKAQGILNSDIPEIGDNAEELTSIIADISLIPSKSQ